MPARTAHSTRSRCRRCRGLPRSRALNSSATTSSWTFVLGAPMDQAVRQHGVGRAPDARELEFDAGLAAAFGDRLVDLARPVAAAELGPHIVVARHALGRHVGIELERPPGHGDVGAAALRRARARSAACRCSTRDRSCRKRCRRKSCARAYAFRASAGREPAAPRPPARRMVSHAAAGQPPAATSAPVIGGPIRPPMLEPCISRPVDAPTSSRPR